MRKLTVITFAAAALAAGCDDYTGPSLLAESYALARIGLQVPPIPLGPDGGAPFLLADTLRLDDDRPRDETGAVLTRIQVVRDDNGATQRLESEHRYQLEGDILTYDSCPIDALCIASLVYAPLEFQVIGDSLFQTGPHRVAYPAGELLMAAYILVDITINDLQTYERYKLLAPASIAAYGGKYLVRGGRTEILEGDWQPSRLVILEFPGAEDAKAWWESEEYAAAKALRQSCTTTDMLLVEGFPGG